MLNELTSNSNQEESITLKPMPRLPLIIIGVGILLTPLPFNPLPTIIISSFGLFLLLQSFTLKLEFTSKALVVKQFGREIRNFPFNKWLAWRLLLPNLPGLLYFREEASPHLLPIIFDIKTLKEQLRLKVGELETSQKETTKVSEQTKAK